MQDILIKRTALPDGVVEQHIAHHFSKLEQNNHEFGLDWLRHLAATALDSPDQAWIYTASSANGEYIALPLRLNEQRGEAHALSTFYTALYAPLVQAQDPAPLLRALLRHLKHTLRLRTVTLSPLDSSSAHYQWLRTGLSEAGWRGIHSWTCFGNWTCKVPSGGYPEYLASRPSRLRNTLARKTRKFLADGRGSLHVVEGGAELSAAIADFQHIYKHSWKHTEPHPQFIPGLLALSAQRGWLRLGIARYDNKPVAAQIWLISNATAAIFKLAYHEDFKRLSAGTVLTAHLMQHAMDKDRVSLIDYLTGDDNYKKDWMETRQERNGIAAYNAASPAGFLALMRHQFKTLLKAMRR